MVCNYTARTRPSSTYTTWYHNSKVSSDTKRKAWKLRVETANNDEGISSVSSGNYPFSMQFFRDTLTQFREHSISSIKTSAGLPNAHPSRNSNSMPQPERLILAPSQALLFSNSFLSLAHPLSLSLSLCLSSHEIFLRRQTFRWNKHDTSDTYFLCASG